MTATQLLPRPADPQFAGIVDELSRRGFLGGLAGSVALLGLAACGAPSTPDEVGAPTGRWAYTDDDGVTVDLPAAPRRIVATHDEIASALWPAGVHLVGAPMVEGNLPTLRAASVPEGDVTAIYAGTDLNHEALLACAPDLIVVQSDGAQSPMLTAEPGITDIAPVVRMNIYSQSVDAIIASAHRLGSALGIPPADAPAQQAYQHATAGFRAAVAAKPGIRMVWCYGSDTELGAYVGDKWSFSLTLAALGLQFPAIGTVNGATMAISWEAMPSAPVDLVVWGAGTLPTNPAWQAMPAVRAGQYLDLSQVGTGYNYADFTRLLDTLTALVEKSHVLVPDTGEGTR